MATVFFRGVVVDVINSLNSLTVLRKSIDEYKDAISTPSMREFPRNTAIVKQISEGAAKNDGREIVCYPFFSSHLAMPLKPGESVWFIFEDPDQKGQIAYWISRVTEPNHVEDANYTFFSRTYRQLPTKLKKKSSEKFDGGDQQSDFEQTFSFNSPTDNPQELIEVVSVAQDVHRFEAVPRYSKRPGDLIIQGSNNSLIMLGEERGHSSDDAGDFLFSANDNTIPAGSAAIDIVVGRGKFAGTSSRAIKNEFSLQETDKRENSTTEGDADFLFDAARMYLTANSSDPDAPYNPDELLSLDDPNYKNLDGINFDNKTGSFAVIKADNLRLIARATGNVKIIKEPSPDGGIDGSALIMHEDGTIQVNGGRINLSSYSSTETLQPYVRYNELVSFLSSILQDLQAFCATMVTHVTPGYGAPSPQITAASSTLLTNVAAKIVLLETATAGLGSTVIYGE